MQSVYDKTLRKRRVDRITEIMSEFMPKEASILDLGSGNADLAYNLSGINANLKFTAIDVKVPPSPRMDVGIYDGKNIPYPDDYFDYVMLITVLHHTDDYIPVLKEAMRVSRKGLIVFDHQYKSYFEWLTLCVIDWPGNVPFGVYTPFNYKKREEWDSIFEALNLSQSKYNDRVYLFGKFFDFIIGKRLHFVSVLDKRAR